MTPATPADLTTDEGRWLVERAAALRLQGLTKNGAAKQALEELLRTRAERPKAAEPPAPPPRACKVCGDARPFRQAGSLTLCQRGHKQPEGR